MGALSTQSTGLEQERYQKADRMSACLGQMVGGWCNRVKFPYVLADLAQMVAAERIRRDHGDLICSGYDERFNHREQTLIIFSVIFGFSCRDERMQRHASTPK
jgi:hypothetical protein